MRSKTKEPRKHSGDHSYVINFLEYCIQQGDTNYKDAAWRIWENEWMNPVTSKTGGDYNLLEKECERTWAKAKGQVDAGTSDQKKLKEFEKLSTAIEVVNNRCRYDTFLGQYMAGDTPTNPAVEYAVYNSQADEKTYIEKHFFQTAFEVNGMPQVNALKEWGDKLPAWDRKDWLKELINCVPAKDPKQAKLFITGWMINAFTQAVNPQNLDIGYIVNRWFLILHQQRQGSGKTRFLHWLSPFPAWVKENGLEDNKDGYIALSKYFFVLDDELGGLSRVVQHERLKSMISVSKIDVRPPYGKTDVSLPRTASFCGSTNNGDIFPSTEGTSRFLVLPLVDEDFKWGYYTKKVDRTKLWAQVKHLCTTDWLEKNTPTITSYRIDTNLNFVNETVESFVISEYLKVSDSSGYVVQTGEVLERLTSSYDYKGLGLNRLGKELRKTFGPPVFGTTEKGLRRFGWRIQFCTTSSTTRTTPRGKKGKFRS
jgi:hypothetical protein